MWLIYNFRAPDRPASVCFYHIEASHKIARFDWLIHWAENVEGSYDQLYLGYPFHHHRGPEPVVITLRNARETLVALMSNPDVRSILIAVDYEIAKLATAIASWRGMAASTNWNANTLLTLTDLSSYEP